MTRSRLLMTLIHVAGWLLLFSLTIGFVFTTRESGGLFNRIFSRYYLLFYAVYIFLFYFNSLLLIPFLYLKKRYAAYFAIVAAMFVAVYFIRPFDNLIDSHGRESGSMQRPSPPSGPRHFEPPPGNLPRDNRPGDPPLAGRSAKDFPPHFKPGQGPQMQSFGKKPTTDIISLNLFVMIWSLSSASWILKQWRITERRAARAESDRANAELSFLRAQINPHFLYNTLNNIYTLAVTKSEKTPVSIMKLSNIMRYMTDEVSQRYVPLQSEIDCVRDYVDLQRLRLSSKVKVDFTTTGNLEGKQIAPLILMPFIENAFKHGISNHEPSSIIMRLSTEAESIHFFCQNNIFKATTLEERTGIGIDNTKQRLDYVYQGKHVLHLTTDQGLFTVELTLQL